MTTLILWSAIIPTTDLLLADGRVAVGDLVPVALIYRPESLNPHDGTYTLRISARGPDGVQRPAETQLTVDQLRELRDTISKVLGDRRTA